jgi:hypothetical protein
MVIFDKANIEANGRFKAVLDYRNFTVWNQNTNYTIDKDAQGQMLPGLIDFYAHRSDCGMDIEWTTDPGNDKISMRSSSNFSGTGSKCQLTSVRLAIFYIEAF